MSTKAPGRRAQHGARNPRSKLTEHQVREILATIGITEDADEAMKHGASENTVQAIRTGTRWASFEPSLPRRSPSWRRTRQLQRITQ